MQFDETALDQLFQLQAKRLADIANNGDTFHLVNSEKSFKGLFDRQKNTITFAAGTPVHAGATLDHKSGQFYVAAIQGKAGVTVASIMPIVGTLETMTAKSTAAGTTYSAKGSTPLLSRSAGELGVPAFGAPATGSTVKSGGQLLTVAGVRREGPVTVLRVQSVQVEKGYVRPDHDRDDRKAQFLRDPIDIPRKAMGPMTLAPDTRDNLNGWRR